MAQKVERIIVGTVETATREPSSSNGNPRFTLTIKNGAGQVVEVTTRPDSSHAYGIQEFLGKQVRVTYGPFYKKLALNTIEELS